MAFAITQAFARLRRSRAAKPLLVGFAASQIVAGAWISQQPLTQATQAVHGLGETIAAAAPVAATYLRLKAEGKV